ncbi:MAG TPA: hypothetical protein VF828_05065 [Patescibacteria group bacterium]
MAVDSQTEPGTLTQRLTDLVNRANRIKEGPDHLLDATRSGIDAGHRLFNDFTALLNEKLPE